MPKMVMSHTCLLLLVIYSDSNFIVHKYTEPITPNDEKLAIVRRNIGTTSVLHGNMSWHGLNIAVMICSIHPGHTLLDPLNAKVLAVNNIAYKVEAVDTVREGPFTPQIGRQRAHYVGSRLRERTE